MSQRVGSWWDVLLVDAVRICGEDWESVASSLVARAPSIPVTPSACSQRYRSLCVQYQGEEELGSENVLKIVAERVVKQRMYELMNALAVASRSIDQLESSVRTGGAELAAVQEREWSHALKSALQWVQIHPLKAQEEPQPEIVDENVADKKEYSKSEAHVVYVENAERNDVTKKLDEKMEVDEEIVTEVKPEKEGKHISNETRLTEQSVTKEDIKMEPVEMEKDECKKKMLEVLAILRQNSDAAMFSQPITAQDISIQEYTRIVKVPMDLVQIQERVMSHSPQEYGPVNLWRDLLLMFTNAVIFNPPGTPFYQTAEFLLDTVRADMGSAFPELRAAHEETTGKAVGRRRSKKQTRRSLSLGAPPLLPPPSTNELCR